nr:hypothetical protein [Mesomycoplasma dispar]
MMEKLKKILTFSIPSTFTPFTLLSCVVQPAWERQELNANFNVATSSPGAFKVGFNTFAWPSRQDDYHVNSFLVQTVYENNLEIEKSGISEESKTKKDKSFNYEISSPSYSYNAFVNLKAILLVDQDGTEHLFDSDDHEIGYLEKGQKAKSLVIQLGSNNKKSINSDFFKKTLESAKKMQFFLKDNIPWVDYLGNPSGFYVKPEDYFYGFRASRLSEPAYRARFGGSLEIDKMAQEKIPNFDPKSSYFTNTISNFYLLDLFGLDTANFDKEDKYIQEYQGSFSDYKGKKALSFEKGTTKDKVFLSGFFDKIVLAGMLRPIPSDFINKRNKETATEKDGILQGRFGETGDALKFGAYWYGEDFKKDMLFNSPYTITVWDQHLQSWKINKHYPRTDWQKILPYTFKKINFNYSKYSSPSAFESSKFNSYREGTLMTVGFDSLNESQKNLVAADQKKYGWTLQRAETKNSLHKWYYSLLVPGSLKQEFRPETGVNFDENYYGFNNNFAKLNYGVSLSELASGKAKVIENLVSGPSLEFRQIIANAFNLYTTSQTISSQALAWYNFIAPDNKINSSPTSKTARDYYKEANTIKLVDSEGKVYYQKDPETEKQQNFANVNNAQKQFQTSNFEVLKARMKKLLDKFYADNKLSASEKVSWTSHSFYTNTPQRSIAAIEEAAKAIESLDPRLEIKLIWPITDLKKRINYLLTKTGGLDYGGWVYDYNGIGSVLDGRIQKNGIGYALLSAIYAKGENSEIAKSYPQIYKYAVAAKKHFDKYAQKGYIRKFEEWKDATNSPDFGADDQHMSPDLINFFIGSVIETQDPKNPGKKIKKWKSFVDVLNEKNQTKGEEIVFDFYAESAIFNLSYQEENNDQDLIQLSSELSSLLSPGLVDLLQVSSSTPYVFLQNPNIIAPRASDTYGDYVPPDMIFIKPLMEKAKKANETGDN